MLRERDCGVRYDVPRMSTNQVAVYMVVCEYKMNYMQYSDTAFGVSGWATLTVTRVASANILEDFSDKIRLS